MLFPAVALLAHMGESVPAEGATALARLAAFVLSPRKIFQVASQTEYFPQLQERPTRADEFTLSLC